MKIVAFVAVSLLDVCVMVVFVASVKLYIYLFVTLFFLLFCATDFFRKEICTVKLFYIIIY